MGKAKDTTKRITISLETETAEGRAAWDWLMAAQEDGSSISQIIAGLIKAAATPRAVAATFAATDDASSQRQESGAILAHILAAIKEQPAALASAMAQVLKTIQIQAVAAPASANGHGHIGGPAMAEPAGEPKRLDDEALEKRKQKLLKRQW